MEKLNFGNSCFFGASSINEIPKEAQNRHFKKAFIITDDGIIENGLFQKVSNVLVKNKIPSVMFSDVTPASTISEVKNAYNAFKKSGADFILAVGGGSTIDVAKAVSVIASNPKYADVISLQGHKNNLKQPLPVFAVPTTAGSAAEISKSIVITDEVTKRSLVCYNDKAIPVETFIDGELMTSMPDIVTLASGFDAFTHAVESLISKFANPFTIALSKEAIKLIGENLTKCYDEPDDLLARENMSYAGYMAGLAYSNSGLGICHSIAHAITTKVNVPHGIALAITLPAVLKFNAYSKSASQYKYIAEAFGESTANLSEDEICRLAIKQVEKFRNEFNIPKKLSDYGVHEEDLDILSVNAFEDACTLSNPREVTMTDIYLILKKLL